MPKFQVGCWVYVENPTEEELKRISADFDLEKNLLNDVFDPYEVPRMETENGSVYVFIRVPFREEDGKVSTFPFLLVIGSDYFMTVSEKPLPFLEDFISQKPNFYTTQKTKLLLMIFSRVDSLYNKLLTVINKGVRMVSVYPEKISNKDILKFVDFEIVLNSFMGSLSPTRYVLDNLLSGKSLKFYKEDKDLIEDLLLDNDQLIRTCKSNLENITNIRSAYDVILTNRLNRVIKLLTALTIIFSIPTIIASFYGMNVRLPLGDSPLAFFGILVFTVLIIAILVVIFIKEKWM